MSSIAEKRLRSSVFYLDESIYSKVLLKKLLLRGVVVEHAGGAIPFGATDEAWLSKCGENGWIVLARDKRIRHRRLELDSLSSHGVAAFIFICGQATADETAEIVDSLLQKFVNMAISEPKPFMYTFGRSKKLSRISLKK